MNVVVLTAGKQHAAVVSAGSKTGAILIGIAFLAVVYVAIGLITGHWSLKQLFSGFDGFGSTSKLQWLLWLIVILYGYVALWVLRAENSDFKVLTDIPVNVLTVLGFSTATAAAAKGITAGYVQTGKVAKPKATENKPPANSTGGTTQLLLNGAPIAVTTWSDTSIKFKVPDADPATGVAWTGLPAVVPLVVSMMGQSGNPATFTVT
jgi:hypothetical protein